MKRDFGLVLQCFVKKIGRLLVRERERERECEHEFVPLA